MTDINLLQNQIKDTTLVSSNRTKLVVWIGVILLLGVIGFGVAIYLLSGKVTTQIEEITRNNNQLKQQISIQEKTLGEAKSYQAKLGNIGLLLNSHISFTPLLEEFEKFTYVKAQFTSMNVSQETGKIHIEGVTDSYNGLGKLLLGLSTSPDFQNVKLLSVLRSGAETAGYLFSIDLNATANSFTKTP